MAGPSGWCLRGYPEARDRAHHRALIQFTLYNRLVPTPAASICKSIAPSISLHLRFGTAAEVFQSGQSPKRGDLDAQEPLGSQVALGRQFLAEGNCRSFGNCAIRCSDRYANGRSNKISGIQFCFFGGSSLAPATKEDTHNGSGKHDATRPGSRDCMPRTLHVPKSSKHKSHTHL